MVPRDVLVALVRAEPVLDGRYEAPAPVGVGGGPGYFSAVFKARDKVTGESVALKFNVDRGDTYRNRSFEREGQLLNGVLRDEPRFVRALGTPVQTQLQVSTQAGAHAQIPLQYLPLEWVELGDVGSLNIQPPNDHTTLLDVLELFEGMVASVRRLHHLGVVHRDLKPTNFFVTGDGGIKLGDFGTARLLGSLEPDLCTDYKGPVGDLRYAPPEAFAGAPPTPTSLRGYDIYALGAVLFEMLSGIQLHTVSLAPLDLPGVNRRLRLLPSSQRAAAFAKRHGRGPSLPSLRTHCPLLPPCAFPRLQELIGYLAHFHPLNRVNDFARIDRMIRICSLVTRNDQQQRRHYIQRRKRIAARRQHGAQENRPSV